MHIFAFIVNTRFKRISKGLGSGTGKLSMEPESLAAAYSSRALSLWGKKQSIGFIRGGLQAREGSSAVGCGSGPGASAPKGLWSYGVLGTYSCSIITMLACHPITLFIK